MYSVVMRKSVDKFIADGVFLSQLVGFVMPSRKNGFSIGGQVIKNIKITDKKLAYPIVFSKVQKKYVKLVSVLTELLTSDDDSGDAFREALNQIEKFRLEIKNKYRSFLKRKELEMMSKQLSVLQKEAATRFCELQNSLINQNTIGKGK